MDRILLAALMFLFCVSSADAQAPAPAPAQLALIDFNSPDAGKQVVAGKGVPAGSTIAVDKSGIVVNFTAWQKGDADHPSFHITPPNGKSWDLSAYGHVEARITNTGDKGIKINVHVVPTGEGFWTERNQEGVQIQPGQSGVIKVVFGYSKGFKPAPPINSASIAEVYIFLYHSTQPHSFRIDGLTVGGVAGEKPDAVSAP